MQATEVADRYARALFENEDAQKNREQVFAEMRELSKVFSDATIRNFVRAKVISAGDKRRAIESVFNNRPIASAVKNLLLLLTEKSRLELFPLVVECFEKLTDEQHGVRRGSVTSASTLTPEERKQIEAKVSEVTGRKVILSYHEDPNMIGGLIAEVGGFLFDDSIKSHIRRMREELGKSH